MMLYMIADVRNDEAGVWLTVDMEKELSHLNISLFSHIWRSKLLVNNLFSERKLCRTLVKTLSFLNTSSKNEA